MVGNTKAILLFVAFFGIAHIGLCQKAMKVKLEDLSGEPILLPDVIDSSLAVVVFFSPECPLCKNYTLTLNELVEKEPHLSIVAVYSGTDYDAETIAAFDKKYNNAFTSLRDKKYKLAKAFGASVTPEAFLITPSGKVIYRGLIDNWVINLGGNHRREITAHYLTDAIAAYRAGAVPAIQQTEPKGCLLYAR